MSIMKCGHPDKWVMKLKWNGRVYTYCLACLVEMLKMDNLEVYNNPYIKSEKKVKPKVEKVVEAEFTEVEMPKKVVIPDVIKTKHPKVKKE